MLSQPDYGEQALEIVEVLIRSGAVSIIVIDSVAALVPKAEIDGEMGDSHMGLQARLMSQALRKITALCSKSDCIVIFINQLRHKIGIVFGNPEVTTGGNALKFYSSVRLEIRRVTSIKQGEQLVGNRTRIKVAKNKMAPPFGTTEVDIMFNQGISYYGAIVDTASQAGIIKKSGSWFAYQDQKIGQGRENVKQFLQDKPALALEIENAIYDFYQLPHLKRIKLFVFSSQFYHISRFSCFYCISRFSSYHCFSCFYFFGFGFGIALTSVFGFSESITSGELENELVSFLAVVFWANFFFKWGS